MLKGRVSKGDKAAPETYKEVYAKLGVDAIIYFTGQYNPAGLTVRVPVFLVVLNDGRVEYSYDDGELIRRRQLIGAQFTHANLANDKVRERVFGQMYNNFIKGDDSTINESLD